MTKAADIPPMWIQQADRVSTKSNLTKLAKTHKINNENEIAELHAEIRIWVMTYYDFGEFVRSKQSKNNIKKKLHNFRKLLGTLTDELIKFSDIKSSDSSLFFSKKERQIIRDAMILMDNKVKQQLFLIKNKRPRSKYFHIHLAVENIANFWTDTLDRVPTFKEFKGTPISPLGAFCFDVMKLIDPKSTPHINTALRKHIRTKNKFIGGKK